MPYLAHFGLEEHPFTLTPDVDYFFPTQEHANIIGSVEFALRRDTGIIKVVGPVGTGKTLLCRLLIKKLVDTEAVAYINAPRANANSIVLAVCKEFGIEVSDADAAYGALNKFLVEEHAKNHLAVLVVDEAQHLGKEGLELVRLISNLETEKRKLLQIVMFGQTELDELLADPSLRQLTQRIAFSLATKPLTIEESKNYINHRLRVSRREGIIYDVFTNRAIDLLSRSCGGVPRVINIVADKSLLAAFAAGSPVVQPAHVTEALKESPALVNPVAPRGGLLRRLLGRAVAYIGGLFVIAVAAVAILAIVPAGQTGSHIRAALHSAGIALWSSPTTAALQAPATTPTQTVTPSPATTPQATTAATPPTPAQSPAAAVAPQPAPAAQASDAKPQAPSAAAVVTVVAPVTVTAPAAAPAPAAPTAPAAIEATKPAEARKTETAATAPTTAAPAAGTPIAAAAPSATPAATGTSSPPSASTTTSTQAVAVVPAQPSARAAMHKIKHPAAAKKKQPSATPNAAPKTTPASPSATAPQRVEDGPQASAAPREAVIVERIAPPASQTQAPSAVSAGTPRPNP
ncbi:MAG TPA: AAA family ATPase [Magnetospirillaceae bacterium]|jgi:type II secretory pathway predicted ATPase ExeA